MTAAVYARVSTADGRQDTESQRADLRQFASTQGWEIQLSTSTEKAEAAGIAPNTGACLRTRLKRSSIWSWFGR
jgi:DNA invertase Pin-like site-specific DNA recombinase